VILDLYQGFYQGTRLRPGDRILSADANPSIQARGHWHLFPVLPPDRGISLAAGGGWALCLVA